MPTLTPNTMRTTLKKKVFYNVSWNSRLNPCRALDYHCVKKGYLSSCKFSKVWRGADRYLSMCLPCIQQPNALLTSKKCHVFGTPKIYNIIRGVSHRSDLNSQVQKQLPFPCFRCTRTGVLYFMSTTWLSYSFSVAHCLCLDRQ